MTFAELWEISKPSFQCDMLAKYQVYLLPELYDEMIPRWSKKWVAGLEWIKKARGCWVCLRPVDCQRPWTGAFYHLTNLWERLIHSSFLLHHLGDLHNTSWHHESSTQSYAKTHTHVLVMPTIITEDKRKVCWWVSDLFYGAGRGVEGAEIGGTAVT